MSLLIIKSARGSFDLTAGSDERFYITKQIHDLHDLETREASFSKSLTLPYTANNVRLIENNSPSMTRHSATGTRFIKVDVLMRGMVVIPNGLMRVENGADEGFNITLFSAEVGFFEALLNEELQNLDWSDLDIEWTVVNLEATRNNTTGFVYPQVTWFSNASFRAYNTFNVDTVQDGIRDQDYTNGGFYIYVKDVLDRIFAAPSFENITVDYGDLTNNDTFNRMAFACKMDLLRQDDRATTPAIRGSADQTIPVEQLKTGHNAKIGITATALVGGITLVNDEFIIPTTGRTHIYATVQTSDLGDIERSGFSLSLMKNDEVIFSETTYNPNFWGLVFNVFAPLQTNDRVWIRATTGGSVTDDRLVCLMQGARVTIQRDGTGTFLVPINEYIPTGIAQKSFVRGVLNMFNMVIKEINGVVTFKLWDDVPKQEAREIDINEIQPWTESGIFGGYSRRNIMRYSPSEDVERTDTSASFQMDVDGLDEDEVKIEIPFNATDENELGVDFRASVPAYNIQKIESNGITANLNLGTTTVIFSDQVNIAIGDIFYNTGRNQVRKFISHTSGNTYELDINTTDNETTTAWYIRKTLVGQNAPLHLAIMETETGKDFTIRDGGLATPIAGDFKQAVFTQQLAFSSIIDVYFRNLVSSLRSPYVLTAWFDISILTFVEIDPLKPLYLPSFGASFYINIMQQYKASGQVRIELIRIGASNVVVDPQGLQVGAFDDSFSDAFDNYSQNEI